MSEHADLDPSVLAAAAGGDERAWAQVVERFKRLVYSVPKKYRLSADQCDDVFQTVFAALVRELPRLKDFQSLPKWLITTTHRECWRVSRNTAAAAATEHRVADEVMPSDAVEHWERIHALDVALSELGGRCEQLLRLLHAGSSQTPYERVAEILDMPIGSIGPTRARCLAKLTELMKDPAGGSPTSSTARSATGLRGSE